MYKNNIRCEKKGEKHMKIAKSLGAVYIYIYIVRFYKINNKRSKEAMYFKQT